MHPHPTSRALNFKELNLTNIYELLFSDSPDSVFELVNILRCLKLHELLYTRNIPLNMQPRMTTLYRMRDRKFSEAVIDMS